MRGIHTGTDRLTSLIDLYPRVASARLGSQRSILVSVVLICLFDGMIDEATALPMPGMFWSSLSAMGWPVAGLLALGRGLELKGRAGTATAEPASTKAQKRIEILKRSMTISMNSNGQSRFLRSESEKLFREN